MMSGWRKFTGEDIREFRESGLLYLVNEQFFWPLGLALAVTRNDDGGYEPTIQVLSTDPPERIEDPDAELRGRAEAEYARRRGETL